MIKKNRQITYIESKHVLLLNWTPPSPDSGQVYDRRRRGADEGGAEGGVQATQT
jgi:hypothetical protein